MHEHRIDHDLYRGTLDIIVLSLLAEHDDHGYGLIERLKNRSSGVLEISEGAIYPLLHRLESRELIRSRWGTTRHNRRAKRYLITENGRDFLADRVVQWRRLSGIMNATIERFVAATAGEPAPDRTPSI